MGTAPVRAVPDTNILVSALFWRGKPYEVVHRGLEGRFILVTSKELLEELVATLKGKFHLPDAHLLL